MVRWLLFRLMFLSGTQASAISLLFRVFARLIEGGPGLVKLSSNCPTWWGLTALHYHYETQCIPGPLAWYAHHLPDAVQRY